MPASRNDPSSRPAAASMSAAIACTCACALGFSAALRAHPAASAHRSKRKRAKARAAHIAYNMGSNGLNWSLFPLVPGFWPLLLLQLVNGAAVSFAWSGAQTLIAQLTEGDARYLCRITFFA